LVRRSVTDASGKTHEFFDYDPDYAPPLPAGGVRGDVRRQDFCSACHVPKYFYVDEQRTCMQCCTEFTFSAREQKYWYEFLRFNFHSIAIRCPECRRKRRSEKALRQQIADAKRRLAHTPDDPSVLLDLAESIVQYRELTGRGDLNLAISASRRARRLWKAALSALYWEACSHVAAERPAKAAVLFKEFMSKGPQGRKYVRMVQTARRFLESWGAP